MKSGHPSVFDCEDGVQTPFLRRIRDFAVAEHHDDQPAVSARRYHKPNTIQTLGRTKMTYQESIAQEITSLHEAATISPFATVIGAAAVTEAVTKDVFHIVSENRSGRKTIYFKEWVDRLFGNGVVDESNYSRLKSLLMAGNNVRHNGWRPNSETGSRILSDLNDLFDYLSDISFLRKCHKCEKSIRIRSSRYLSQSTVVKGHAVCPNCKTVLTVDNTWQLSRYEILPG